ncbi:Hypothetical predicted protein [Paramuricea clavata]|uniref:Uncharacterized protein n=1 Tax=Paramuricea clavata TaxID=317549 RepID=A0A7D9E6K2_PARCT|nr:Hypothetical predicted protein [Paramuricea clavata]
MSKDTFGDDDSEEEDNSVDLSCVESVVVEIPGGDEPSSESSPIVVDVTALRSQTFGNRLFTERRFLVQESRDIASFWEKTVALWKEDSLWLENFRMSRGTFDFVCHKISAWRFGVGKSTACEIVNDVCKAIVDVLLSTVLKWPTGGALRTVLDGFLQVWGFPQCAGAIDGTHIPIVAPPQSSTDYYNRKSFYSIVLQAVVEHKYRYNNT